MLPQVTFLKLVLYLLFLEKGGGGALIQARPVFAHSETRYGLIIWLFETDTLSGVMP